MFSINGTLSISQTFHWNYHFDLQVIFKNIAFAISQKEKQRLKSVVVAMNNHGIISDKHSNVWKWCILNENIYILMNFFFFLPFEIIIKQLNRSFFGFIQSSIFSMNISFLQFPYAQMKSISLFFLYSHSKNRSLEVIVLLIFVLETKKS